jgi:hypothetical protein
MDDEAILSISLSYAVDGWRGNTLNFLQAFGVDTDICLFYNEALVLQSYIDVCDDESV